MRISNQKDFVVGLAYVAFGLAVALGSMTYEVGTPARMGPGFFPMCAGFALALLGLPVLAGALAVTGEKVTLDSWAVRPLLAVLLAVILFGLLLEPAGLIVAVPVLVIVSSIGHHAFRWRTALVSAAILLPLVFAIFILLLGMQFPLLPAFIR